MTQPRTVAVLFGGASPEHEVSIQSAAKVAAAIGATDSAETIYLLLEHLAANGRARATGAEDPGKITFVRK